jgi:hypothetical protein
MNEYSFIYQPPVSAVKKNEKPGPNCVFLLEGGRIRLSDAVDQESEQTFSCGYMPMGSRSPF